MRETVELARFVADTRFEDLPAEVIEKMKIYILDNFACGLLGSVQPWSKIVAGVTRAAGGKEEASVFNMPWKIDISRAALVNGAMMGAYEVEHVGHAAHPSGTAFPAALAVAEREHIDGRSFLLALTLGYEVACRIGDAQTNATEHERGFHNPAVNGPFSAALAVGKLMQVDLDTLVNALGIAGSHACGLVEFAWEGAMTKRFHLGRATQLGLESLILAKNGLTGPSTILEGQYGYFQAYSPRPKIEKLLADIGNEWLLLSLIIKTYCTHVNCQALVYGIEEFKKNMPVDATNITDIEVVLGSEHMMQKRHQNLEPTNLLGGQYSIPFTIAVALCKDMSDPLVFNEENLWDPVVRATAKKIKTRYDKEYFGKDVTRWSADIIVSTGDEKHHIRVEDFKGSLSKPYSYQDACEKFQRYTKDLIDQQRMDKIQEMVWHLEDLNDMSQLACLIGGK
jgi:2-methylcitrate dehydratase PrpD